MKNSYLRVSLTIVGLLLLSVFSNSVIAQQDSAENKSEGLEYLKGLEGKWVVQNEKEGTFDWDFYVTSKGGVVIERLKIGTPTEMTTTYFIVDGKLHATHFCQLQNQPHLSESESDMEGDLHFSCDGNVGNTKSHDELHLHGVHYKKEGESVVVSMEMFKHGEVVGRPVYTLNKAK